MIEKHIERIEYLTAITGGIGSGKSVVSDILRVMGYPVYDCDSEAKFIMDGNDDIKNALKEHVSPQAVNSDGSLNRKEISRVVFSDPASLAFLNAIVHGAVLDDLRRWCAGQSCGHLFVETAILYQSGLDRLVGDVIEVTAPDDLRILRVMKRSGLDEHEVASRIAAQIIMPDKPHERITAISNDGYNALLPQITEYLDRSAGFRN